MPVALPSILPSRIDSGTTQFMWLSPLPMSSEAHSVHLPPLQAQFRILEEPVTELASIIFLIEKIPRQVFRHASAAATPSSSSSASQGGFDLQVSCSVSTNNSADCGMETLILLNLVRLKCVVS